MYSGTPVDNGRFVGPRGDADANLEAIEVIDFASGAVERSVEVDAEVAAAFTDRLFWSVTPAVGDRVLVSAGSGDAPNPAPALIVDLDAETAEVIQLAPRALLMHAPLIRPAATATAAGSTSSTTAVPATTAPPTTAAPAPDVRAVDVMNALLPEGVCTPPGDGWPSGGPVQLVDGTGETFRTPDEPDKYGSLVPQGNYIAETVVAGYADVDGDGVEDVVSDLTCSGSPQERCCAGRGSIVSYAVVLGVDSDGRLSLVGHAIGPTTENSEYKTITGVELVGSSVVTVERCVRSAGSDGRG